MRREKFIVLSFLIFVLSILPNVRLGAKVPSSLYSQDVVTLPKEIRERVKNSTPSASLRIPILMYHYVEYVKDPGDTIRKSLNIVPFIFQKQLETLVDGGYNFITLSQLANMLDGKEEVPPRPIILSFDDGYQDFYDNVFPLLKKNNVKAVNYIIAGFLDKPNFMSSWEVQEIATSGAVEVGSHSVNHIQLKGVSKVRAKYEINESKNMLEKLTGSPVVSFAYPSGSFDLQAENIVSHAGYKTAVSTVPGIVATDQNKYFLYRIRPGNRIGQDLLDYLSQNTFKPF